MDDQPFTPEELEARLVELCKIYHENPVLEAWALAIHFAKHAELIQGFNYAYYAMIMDPEFDVGPDGVLRNPGIEGPAKVEESNIIDATDLFGGPKKPDDTVH